MSNLRPESRIKSLEQRATDIEAGIIELSSDQAEELKAIRQEIKTLNDGMMSSFKELGNYFELTEKAMATKDDIGRIETRLDTMATKEDLATMKNEILDAMKQLLQQKPSE